MYKFVGIGVIVFTTINILYSSSSGLTVTRVTLTPGARSHVVVHIYSYFQKPLRADFVFSFTPSLFSCRADHGLQTRYCWVIEGPSLWITGQDPQNGPAYIKLGNRPWLRQCRRRGSLSVGARNVAKEWRKLKMDRREKGISVRMALKLINRDETASVIKTGNIGARDVVFYSDVRAHVCVHNNM